MDLRTCVIPPGRFRYGIHKPRYRIHNLRENDFITPLGTDGSGRSYVNHANFPAGSLGEDRADTIFEIPNPFPFRGVTYIAKSWADANAEDPGRIRLPAPAPVSFCSVMEKWRAAGLLSALNPEKLFADLPEPVMLALAVTSSDPEDLIGLARLCCEFEFDRDGRTPRGLRFESTGHGRLRPCIKNYPVYEALANNPHLPDRYKVVMVLQPGVQGGSEIVGEWRPSENASHVFEYLRRNSYIPWGHYAANMAHDAVRYRIEELTSADITGLRHLYYQRTYVRLAEQLGLALPAERKTLAVAELEALRLEIQSALSAGKESPSPCFNATLWGWNFGFDFSPSRYRLHASHQQIHQQFALIPQTVLTEQGDAPSGQLPQNQMESYACGDMIHEFITAYRAQTDRDFFRDYFQAMRTNRRMDGRKDRESGLVIHEDNHVILFVPKAQTSQWEIQLATTRPVGNIIETNTDQRRSLDHAILIAMKILSDLGGRMVTVIEYSSRFRPENKEFHLLYTFLPRLPESPGAFSEAQLRWINGHYPEDFAAACRRSLSRRLSVCSSS